MWLALAAAAAGLLLGAASPRADDTSAEAEDKQQEREIRTKLQNAPDLKNNRVDVEVDDGIAKLEGSVDSARERNKATGLAHVEGVLGVDNRLVIRSPAK